MNPRRGRESKLHIEAKVIAGNLFPAPEWTVFFEQRDADVLVLHNANRFVAAIEVESTPRNVLRNIERDLANGCHAVATITLQQRLHLQICNKIRKHYPDLFGTRLQVFPCDAPGLGQFADWINALAQSHAPYASPVSINPQPKEKQP